MPKCKPPPTPAEINAENHRFWERENARLDEQGKQHPDEVKQATDEVQDFLLAGAGGGLTNAQDPDYTKRAKLAARTSLNAVTARIQQKREADVKAAATATQRLITGESAAKRKERNRTRDALIRKLHGEQKNPKDIASCKDVFGSMPGSAAELQKRLKIVYRVLQSAERPTLP